MPLLRTLARAGMLLYSESKGRGQLGCCVCGPNKVEGGDQLSQDLRQIRFDPTG